LEFGTTGVTLKDTIIGSINTTEYWLGFFGLGDIPGNFTDTEALPPLNALENQSIIPSNSYGYTAGAIYRKLNVDFFSGFANPDAFIEGKSEPCSLTLGGYDANRFVPHNFSFGLNPVLQQEAWLNSISVASGSSNGKPQNWSSNPLQLLAPSDGVYVTIDSSTPFLWLPKSTCESFAQALGLTYNDSLALYTFDGNASIHNELQNLNLNFTFSLSDASTPSQIVNITLPYAAFDLQLSYPYIPNTTYATGNKYYFPLRQAANDTQYTLGRAFLQEAYIITDYERNNFSVYQALHPANPGNTSIVDILKPGTSSPKPATSGPLSTPIIIGIAIGSAALLLLLALITFLIHRHRRRCQQHAIILESKPAPSPFSPASASLSPNTTRHSPSTALTSPVAVSALSPGLFEADSRPRTPPVEISADAEREYFELAAPNFWPEELDSRSISSRRGEQEKFAAPAQGGWAGDGENGSGAKCRASMKQHKGK
jgi:hypothetical protein